MGKFFGVVLLILVSGYIGFLFGNKQLSWQFYNYKPSIIVNKEPEVAKQADFSMFWTVWDKLGQEYVDKKALDPKKMIEGAISGMVSSLGDPYTAYLPATQNKDAKADLAGEFGGVGIQLGYKNNILTVVAPVPDTPAERAGVKAGDLILHIKDLEKKIDLDTDKMAIITAVGYIRGKKGTTVSLTFGREGASAPIKVDLVRDTIIDKSVTLKIIDNKIAHLRLSKFGDRTPQEWQDAIAKIGDMPIVLDLRNNPGGYLEGSVYIASEFLSQGKLVVVQQAGMVQILNIK